jgi:hypothetical protein
LFKFPQIHARLPRAELQALGVKPGPEFDRILSQIFASQLDGKIKSHTQLMKEMRALAGIKEPPPPPPPKKGKEAAPEVPAARPRKKGRESSAAPSPAHPPVGKETTAPAPTPPPPAPPAKPRAKAVTVSRTARAKPKRATEPHSRKVAKPASKRGNKRKKR